MYIFDVTINISLIHFYNMSLYVINFSCSFFSIQNAMLKFLVICLIANFNSFTKAPNLYLRHLLGWLVYALFCNFVSILKLLFFFLIKITYSLCNIMEKLHTNQSLYRLLRLHRNFLEMKKFSRNTQNSLNYHKV